MHIVFHIIGCIRKFFFFCLSFFNYLSCFDISNSPNRWPTYFSSLNIFTCKKEDISGQIIFLIFIIQHRVRRAMWSFYSAQNIILQLSIYILTYNHDYILLNICFLVFLKYAKHFIYSDFFFNFLRRQASSVIFSFVHIYNFRFFNFIYIYILYTHIFFLNIPAR